MRKLALNDEILLKIEKPARYIGNEVNSVMKDPEKVNVRFCMCFPDVYEIGMSHLGIQLLYDQFNPGCHPGEALLQRRVQPVGRSPPGPPFL